MERRGFLKSLAAGAVGWATVGKVADELGLAPAYVGQVKLIPSAEAAGFGSPLVIDASLTAKFQAATFPQSVAAGDPNPNGCVIWTRVSPLVVGAGLQQAAWQIASDPGFAPATIVLQGLALVQPSRDNTIKLPLQSAAMQPFTLYYYRFIFNGVASRTGRFKTMPLPGAQLQQLRIGYVVCQDYSNGFYNAYSYLAQEEVDVVVHLGDYIYEYLSDGSGGTAGGSVRVVPPYPSGAQTPQNLGDYRHLYQVYRADPQIQAMHERFAMILLWDDHEFMNDCHQDFHEDTPNAGETATTPKPLLRQQASQAWWEHGLAAVPFNPNLDWQNSIQIYRSFHFGTLLDLVVTDERLYRDGPPCGDLQSQRYLTQGCTAVTDPARTMLGAAQKQWFLQQVTGSTATWKVWANEVMVCQYLVGPPGAPQVEYFDLDQWDGYPVERAQILGAIKQAGVQNFVALSGDAHLYLASTLKTNFNDPNEAPMGVEFMVGAISSGNYYDAMVEPPVDLSTIPSLPAGAVRAAQTGLPIDSFERLVMAYNPHIKFFNGSTWGYAILTVTSQHMICDFRVVSTVKQPTATLSQLASFMVPVNSASITQTV
ncbi:MAG: alkaline phosphatase D family protein [Janthinobacterium lividum]